VLFLKFRRIELRLTCRDVAKRADINNSWYGQMESGRVNPNPDELKRIAKALKCAPERLLSHVSDASLGDGAEHFDAQRERSFVDRRADATGSTEA
jgi:transcriptional regulator with XRE-family HTH domain